MSPRVSQVAEAKNANMVIFDSGARLHAYSRRLDRMVCGIKSPRGWQQVFGRAWNDHPERRCANCDRLGPNAVLSR